MTTLRPVTRRIIAGAALALALVAVLGPVDHRGAVASSVGGGALVAAVALGVVLTYRSSGVINFANAATATYAAYLFNGLQREGELFLPPLPNPLSLLEGLLHAVGVSQADLPDWPTSLAFGAPLTFGAAFALSLVMASVLGLLMHLLVFRPLRHAPPLAKTVASIGLLLVFQAIVVLRFSSQAMPVKPLLAKRPVDVLGTSIASDQLILGGLVIAATVALWAAFRFTRFGLATRAAAEDEKGALLIGLSPEKLAAANWVLSSVLAAAFGILAATVNASLDPATITLLIIPALGAALVGGLSSFGLTVFAAFAIAGSQTLIQFFAATKTWFPTADGAPLPGVREALPLLVIIAVLFVRGDRLPTRGAIGAGRLPYAPAPTGVAAKTAAGLAVGVTGLLLLGPEWRLATVNSLIGAAMCLSLVVLTGFVGQISLAQMAFAGIGGFTVSKLATDLGIGFPLAPILGAVAAMLVGLVAALPALRVRGVNLAIVTLASAAAVENLVFKNAALSGGIEGAPVPAPRLLGVGLGPNDAASFGDGKLPSPLFGILCLLVVVALAILVVNVRRSATGRQLLAVRTNERAAAAGGINVTGAKLLAFALAAFIAGIAGTLSAYRFGSVSATTFGSFASIGFLAFAYLGGISSVTGAMLGGLLVANGLGFTALDRWFHVEPGFVNLLGGLGLIITAIVHPEGLAGGLQALRRAARLPIRRRAVRPGAAGGRTRGRGRGGDLMALLEAKGITVSFGALRAVADLSLSVGAGRLVGLIGPNGAGKTTFVDAITGFTPHDGSLVFDGRDLTGALPHQRARAGLVRTWQSVELFDDLTVRENLAAVAHRQRAGSLLLDLVRPRRALDGAPVERALAAVGVTELADLRPRELSHGQRMLVGVARALATAPGLVCMDEPAAGLDTAESEALGQRLRRIVDDGTSVLLIDHDMGLVLNCCDEIYVIEFGRLIAHGPPAEVRADPRVIEVYLGSTASEVAP